MNAGDGAVQPGGEHYHDLFKALEARSTLCGANVDWYENGQPSFEPEDALDSRGSFTMRVTVWAWTPPTKRVEASRSTPGGVVENVMPRKKHEVWVQAVRSTDGSCVSDEIKQRAATIAYAWGSVAGSAEACGIAAVHEWGVDAEQRFVWLVLERVPGTRLSEGFRLTRRPSGPGGWASASDVGYTSGSESDGGRLRRRANSHDHDPQLLSDANATTILLELCRSLHALHQQGWVHGAVCPASIIDGGDSAAGVTRYKLANLGFVTTRGSKTLEESHFVTSKTLRDSCCLAPEQWRGDPVDERTDVYALGCTLYFLLAGDHLNEPEQYHEEDPDDDEGKYREDVKKKCAEREGGVQTGALRHVAPHIREVIDKATSTQKDRRFDTAAQMAEAVTAKSSVAHYDVVISYDSACEVDAALANMLHDELTGETAERLVVREGGVVSGTGAGGADSDEDGTGGLRVFLDAKVCKRSDNVLQMYTSAAHSATLVVPIVSAAAIAAMSHLESGDATDAEKDSATGMGAVRDRRIAAGTNSDVQSEVLAQWKYAMEMMREGHVRAIHPIFVSSGCLRLIDGQKGNLARHWLLANTSVSWADGMHVVEGQNWKYIGARHKDANGVPRNFTIPNGESSRTRAMLERAITSRLSSTATAAATTTTGGGALLRREGTRATVNSICASAGIHLSTVLSSVGGAMRFGQERDRPKIGAARLKRPRRQGRPADDAIDRAANAPKALLKGADTVQKVAVVRKLSEIVDQFQSAFVSRAPQLCETAERGLEQAFRLLHRALRYIIDVRVARLNTEQREHLKQTVVDGNTLTSKLYEAVFSEYGMVESLQRQKEQYQEEVESLCTTIDLEAAKVLRQPEPAQDAIQLLRQALETKTPFQDALDAVVAKTRASVEHVEVIHAPVKRLSRVAQKEIFGSTADTYPSENASNIKDMVRAMVSFPNMGGVATFVKDLRESSDLLKVVRIKNRFDDAERDASGWRDLKLNVVVEKAQVKHICEIQVVLQEIRVVHKDLAGHEVYATLRNATEMVELHEKLQRAGKLPAVQQRVSPDASSSSIARGMLLLEPEPHNSRVRVMESGGTVASGRREAEDETKRDAADDGGHAVATLQRPKQHTLLLFVAPYCPHCHEFRPQFRAVAAKMAHKFDFQVVDGSIDHGHALFTKAVQSKQQRTFPKLVLLRATDDSDPDFAAVYERQLSDAAAVLEMLDDDKYEAWFKGGESTMPKGLYSCSRSSSVAGRGCAVDAAGESCSMTGEDKAGDFAQRRTHEQFRSRSEMYALGLTCVGREAMEKSSERWRALFADAVDRNMLVALDQECQKIVDRDLSGGMLLRQPLELGGVSREEHEVTAYLGDLSEALDRALTQVVPELQNLAHQCNSAGTGCVVVAHAAETTVAGAGEDECKGGTHAAATGAAEFNLFDHDEAAARARVALEHARDVRAGVSVGVSDFRRVLDYRTVRVVCKTLLSLKDMLSKMRASNKLHIVQLDNLYTPKHDMMSSGGWRFVCLIVKPRGREECVLQVRLVLAQDAAHMGAEAMRRHNDFQAALRCFAIMEGRSAFSSENDKYPQMEIVLRTLGDAIADQVTIHATGANLAGSGLARRARKRNVRGHDGTSELRTAQELLGSQLFSLQTNRVSSPLPKSFGELDYLVLYFGGSWCPQCNELVHHLGKRYNTMKTMQDTKVEVVYVSSDKDYAAFAQYTAQHPRWFCVPFEDKARQRALSDRFHVEVIPSVVVLNLKGERIVTETEWANADVRRDTRCSDFPWKPASLWAEVTLPIEVDAEESFVVVERGGLLNPFEDPMALNGKKAALYFCSRNLSSDGDFTRKLQLCYEKIRRQHDENFYVIVVGTDSSEQECASMFNELSLQGFLAIPPKDVSRRKTLQQRWDVVAPAVVMLELHNNGGKELVRDARAMIEADPYAEDFPWVDSVLFNLESTAVNSIADTPSVIVLGERLGSDAGRKKRVHAAVSHVARTWNEEGQREVLFFKAFSDGRVTKQVRKQLGLRPTGDSIPDVVLVDAYSHYSYNAYCELYDIVPDRASFFEQGLALPPSAHSKHPLYHFVNEFVRNTLPPSLKKESAKQPEVGTTQLSSQSEAEIGDSAADATEYDSDGYTYAF